MRLAWSASAAIAVTGLLTVITPFAQISQHSASARTVPAQLSQSDGASRRQLGGLPEHFDKANSSHDGRLTLAQAQLDGWNRVVRHFAEIDQAGRGYVTLQQLHDYTATHRHPHRSG